MTSKNSQITISQQHLSVARTKTDNIKKLSIPGLDSRLHAPLAVIMPKLTVQGYTIIPVELFADHTTVFISHKTSKDKETKEKITQPIRKFLKVGFENLGKMAIPVVIPPSDDDSNLFWNNPDPKLVGSIYEKVKNKAVSFPVKRLLMENHTDPATIDNALQTSLLKTYRIPDEQSKEILEQLMVLYYSAIKADCLIANLTMAELVKYLILPSLPSREAYETQLTKALPA